MALATRCRELTTLLCRIASITQVRSPDQEVAKKDCHQIRVRVLVVKHVQTLEHVYQTP